MPDKIEIGYTLSSEEHPPYDISRVCTARREGRIQLRRHIGSLSSVDR